MFDAKRVKQDFPMLRKEMNGRKLIYLDSAATTQKPQAVIDALVQFYSEDYATVHRAIYELSIRASERYAKARETLAAFIGAKDPDTVIFTRGTTEALNLVAATYGRSQIQAGDRIILSMLEHHSNIVPWQLLAEETGAELAYIRILPDGSCDLEHYQTLLTPRTKLVSIAHISNVTGTIHPIKEMAALAHQVGALFCVDGAQAAPHHPIDVQELDCDFYALSAHKMYGPTGIGLLYGKAEHLASMPPYQGGGDMIEEVSLQGSTFQKAPHKFEAGTPPIAQAIAFAEAARYLLSHSRTSLLQWEQKLLMYATKKLQAIPGLTLVGTHAHKAPLISFTIKDFHSLDLGTVLALKGIAVRTGHLCAQPYLNEREIETLTRLSFGLYNTMEDVDTFVESLKEALALLQPALSY